MLPVNLRTLSCGRNRLESLPELPGNLIWLYCKKNQLTSLPKLPGNLSTLDCSNNQLKSLPDLPDDLEILHCNNNLLTGLDVTGLPLQSLNCSYNYINDTSAVIGFSIDKWDNSSYIFYPQNIFYGDINGDGVIRRSDQTRLNQFFSGADPSLNNFVEKNADVNGDGILSRSDQTRLNQFFSGVDPSPLGPKTDPNAPSMPKFSAFSAAEPEPGDVPYVKVTSAISEAGGEITYTVSLENNPGISGYGITLFFDDSKLAYVSSEAGDLLPTMFNAAQAFSPISDNRYITFSSADIMGDVDTGRVLFSAKFIIKEGIEVSAINGDDLKLGYYHRFDEFVLSAAQAMKFDIEQAEAIAGSDPQKAPITSIQIDAPSTTTVIRGGIYSFRAILNEGALGDGIIWSVNNPLYATVNSNGIVAVLNKTGTAILTASDPASGLSHSIVLRIL